MMNRTTGGYILMMLVCGAVLWGILHMGIKLQAPTDLSGNWAVIEPGKPNRHAVIQQSGVFAVLTVENEKPTKFRLDQMVLSEHLSKTNAGTELHLSPYRLWREAKDASK